MSFRCRLALLVLAVGASQFSFARVVRNTIDASAVIADGDRRVVVTGPIECDLGERVHVLVTVTQRTTGAIAEGRTLVACTGVEGPWTVEAEVAGRERFAPGGATAVAVAWTVRRGVTTDAHQWLVPVTLVAE